jgi:hypothetical protein
MKMNPATKLARDNLLQDALRLVRVRRDESLTGAQPGSAVAKLLKLSQDENGYVRTSAVKQINIVADNIVEPSTTASINMLDALPPEEAAYYSNGSHVVCWKGKSTALFKEIENHYCFIGGSKSEWVRYLRRPDVQCLWGWLLPEDVEAVAGVSCVLKKNNIDQRKLIMSCAANYAFDDPKQRNDLGMMGGSALNRIIVEGDYWTASACDEDSAFTMIETPDWWLKWQATPAVPAADVFDLLPLYIQEKIVDPLRQLVHPCYKRLAMGGSHSVGILMSVNLYTIGRTLYNLRLHRAGDSSLVQGQDRALSSDQCKGQHSPPLEDALSEGEGPKAMERDNLGLCATEVDDDINILSSSPDGAWGRREHVRSLGTLGQSGYTVETWCNAVRWAQNLGERVF